MMKQRNALTTTVMTVLFVLIGLAVWTTGRPALAQTDYQWPYDQGSKVSYNSNDIYSAWQDWKSANVTSNNAGGNGRLRVMGGVNGNSSVSEGMAYGILFASIFDDQDTFDGLWLFIEDHMDPNGLMHWYIGNPGQLLGQNAATDAEADMAQALINACIKVEQGVWSSSSIDYCQEATDMINAMWDTEVDHPNGTNGLSGNQGYELLPGDSWGDYDSDYPQGIINLSYFAPGYFEVYAKFTGNNGWYDVIDRQYEVTDIVQAKSGNCSGLVPNWNQYDGDAQLVSWQPQNYEWWSYDAARFAWRVAVDQLWYGRAEAAETSNELGSFFASVGLSNTGEHNMGGQLTGSGPYPFFVGNAGAAIYAADQLSGVNCGAANGSVQESPQSAYNKVLSTKDNPTSYYGDAWRLFSLLTMTGNFPNFYEMANSGTTPPTAVPTNVPTNVPTTPPTATNTPQPTPTTPSTAPTNTPQPTATSIPPTTPPTTGGACTVEYTVTNSWGSGYVVQMAVTNNSGTAINGYDLTWTFDNGEVVASSWNVDVSQSGSVVTASQPAGFWNGMMESGDTSSFGMSVNGVTPAMPDDFMLNGVLCNDGGGSNPAPTNTPQPTATDTPPPAATNTPQPTATNTPPPAATNTPQPTATNTPQPTATNTPQPTATSIPATATPVPTTPPTSGGSSCEVHYGIANDWGSGFQAGVAIVNTGSAPVTNWTLTWAYPNGQQITSLWSADHSQSGSDVTVTAPPWSSTIQPGQEVGFGFTGSYSGSNPTPTQFYLNGELCDVPATSSVRIASYARNPADGAAPLAITLGQTNSTTAIVSIMPLFLLIIVASGTALLGWRKTQ